MFKQCVLIVNSNKAMQDKNFFKARHRMEPAPTNEFQFVVEQLQFFSYF